MTLEHLAPRPRVTHGTLIRPLSPLGYYWPTSFRASDMLYSAADDLIFIACHFDESAHEGDYYSEFDTPCLEEVRLLAALSLPIDRHDGTVSLYPCDEELRIAERPDLASAETETYLRDILSRQSGGKQSGPAMPAPPPLWGGPAYGFRERPMPEQLPRRLLDAISIDDHLLLRGLSAWLKADMLRHHRQFGLEALYSLYVALDASFSLICRELVRRGNPSPTAADAGRFLDDAEGREHGTHGYFADFYSDRIQVLHPQNRYGLHPYPPATMSDVYQLSLNLREIFRLLILGEILHSAAA